MFGYSRNSEYFMKHERPLQCPIKLTTEPHHTSETCFFRIHHNETSTNFLKMTLFLMLLCSFAEQFRRNPLKHNGNYMYQCYNTKVALNFFPYCICVFHIIIKKRDFFLHSINKFALVTEAQCIFCYWELNF